MPGARPLARSLRRYAAAAAIAAGWALEPLARTRWPDAARQWLAEVITRVLSGFPGAEVLVVRALDIVWEGVGASFVVTLFLATFALPIGLVLRMVARARRRRATRIPSSGPPPGRRGTLASRPP